MRQTLAIVVCAAGFAGAVLAQAPVITAVQDAGEYSANIAQGSVFVVKGTNLSGSGYNPAPSLPLGTTLAGVKITFTRLNVQNPFDAYMVYTYNVNGVNQLAALLPSSAVAAEYNVTVTNGTAVSASFRATVVPRKFRIITQDGSGSGNAVVQNFISQTQYDVNRLTTGILPGSTITHSPTHPRQVIVIWGTGYGGLSGVGDNIAPGAQDFRSSTSTTVFIGGVSVTPDLYAGRAPGLPGTDEIILTLPANVPTGCTVSLQVSVDGQMSNPTTIAIAPEGADACVSPTYSRDTLIRLDRGGSLTTGAFTLTSFGTSVNFAGSTFNATVEASAGAFTRYSGAQLATAASFTNPSGTCQVFRRTGSQTTLLLGAAGTNLDAGAGLTLSGPGVQATANTLQRDTDRSYYLDLGITVAGLPFPVPGFNASPIVSAGTYQLRGTGGADVGAFTANLTVGSRVTVAPPLPATINRGGGLTVSWTGGGATDLVNLVGYSGTKVGGTTADPIYDAGVFLCTVQASAGRLAIPASVLNQLPVTPPDAFASGTGVGVIAVISNSLPTASNGSFTAPLTAGGSIDAGLFVATVGTLANTQYQ